MIENPVFVRGMSRSGGTLLVTILDSHPNISMSYEIYPRQLDIGEMNGGAEELLELARSLQEQEDPVMALKLLPSKSMSNFVARCPRGGVSHQRFGEILESHVNSGLLLNTSEEKMKVMERCCLDKMEREGKSTWGLKCDNRYSEYIELWPDSFFLNIVRDGRDVLASQLNTGSFNPDPFECGRGWAYTHRKFEQFMEDFPGHGHIVSYEKLCTDPLEEMAEVFFKLGMENNSSALDYHKKDLTIFSASHLSMDRISKPIDTKSIGRWKDEVSNEQMVEFMKSAGDMMEKYGYR